MKIVRGRFSKKMWVVNSKGKRLTQKCASVNIRGTYGVFEVICLDDWSWSSHMIMLFDTRTETIFGKIQSYEKITDDLFAFSYGDNWHFYNAKGKLLREDVNDFVIDDTIRLINATIGGKDYFLDYDLNILSDGFADATAFDKFGYSVVRQCKTGYCGVINTNMEFVIEPFDCDWINPLSKDYFDIRKRYKRGVIDIARKEIVPVEYDEVWFTCGYFRVKYGKNFGLFNKNGNKIFDCIYPEIIETPDKFVVKDFAKLEVTKTKEVAK